MTQATLSVPDISCNHCKMSIEGAVNELDGVDKVEVAIDDRTVDVSFDSPTDMDAIVAAIEGQGYEVAAS
ncbi:MAG: heavy-metal-associated domain-containing protein [bacterium]|nr:heavy-metal-associated domain-containing protein [bacterium]